MIEEEGLDWLGAETAKDKAYLCRQLEQIHDYNSDSGENIEIGTGDFNHKILAEALRIKLLGAELIGEEFDDVVSEIENQLLVISEKSIQDLEEKEIRNMTEAEREEFECQILNAMGRQKLEDGSMKVIKIGFDLKKVRGFALCFKNDEMLITCRSGDHYQAERLFQIKCMKREFKTKETDELFSGFIFQNIGKFKSPLIYIKECYYEETVVEYLKEKGYIPITLEGFLLENSQK